MMFKKILIAAIILSSRSFAGCETDLDAAKRPSVTLGNGFQEILTQKTLTVGTWNVLDLMVSSEKPPADRARIGMQILQSAPDILFLQEVNGMPEFCEKYLNRKYRSFEFDNNDKKRKKIAMLVRDSVSADVQIQNVKDGFQRSIAVVVFRFTHGNPIIFMGVHLKSKKVRKGEDMDALRQRDIENFVSLVKAVRSEFGPHSRIMALGDFNGQLHSDANMLEMLRQADLVDTLDLSNLSLEDRSTHTYFSPNGGRILQQMDGILVSPSVLGAVEGAAVHAPLSSSGEAMPLPRTLEEQFTLPSDHRLVTAKFNLHQLIFSKP